MRSIALPDAGAAATVTETARPTLASHQILVRLAATSINMTDAGTASGRFASFGMPHAYPVTIGRDFAGTVESIGSDVTDFAVGDEVFGELPFVPPLSAGTWSEYVVADATTAVLRPDTVDVASAGAAPLVTVTALMLADALQFTAGETVLVVGATGGVGTVLVQLATAAGTHVIAPARSEDQEFLHDLGVQEFVNRDADIVTAVKAAYPEGVDVIVDLVNYGASGVYDAALKDGGRVGSATNAAGEGERRFDINHYPTRELLTRTAELLAAGTVRIPVSETVSFDDTLEALGRFGSSRHRGKIAIAIR